jgi:hypothetical protein
MERKQGFLGRVVDIGAELFAMSATCVRARTEDNPAGRELAELFCQQSRRRVERLFTELWDNTDALDNKVAKRVTDGRYTFLEEGIVPVEDGGEWVARYPSGPSTVEDVRRRL